MSAHEFMVRNALLCLACVFVVAGLAACAPDTLPPPQNNGVPASPTAGGPLDGTPEPDSLVDEKTPNHPVRRYDCDNGGHIKARYSGTDHALVTYKDANRFMHLAKSADGARYVGDGYEWWTRGTGHGAEATLFKHQDSGSTGDVVATCHEN